MSEELLRLSALDVGERIAGGEVSPVQLLEAQLERAREHNPELRAFISFRAEQALQEARQAEDELRTGRYRGPLHGVPVALKDSIYLAGEPTTLGAQIHRDFRPGFSAAVVEKLRAAGAVIIGKLNMHEYAWGLSNANLYFGTTRNPWNPGKTTGGSSGGNAAAIAADLSFATLGADAAGSIRVPSAICGGVGLKPTFGRVSTHGDHPLAWSLGHVGPMTRTVADAAALLQAVAGYDERDPGSVDTPVPDFSVALDRGVEGLVIGIEEDFFFHRCDSRIEEQVRALIDELVARGARLQQVHLPTLAYSEWIGLMSSLAEASTVHHRTLVERPAEIGSDVRAQLQLGETISAVDYLRAQQLRHRLREEFDSALAQVDVILSPTIPVTTPDVGEETVMVNGRRVGLGSNLIRYCVPANLTGHPALTVPAGLVDALPIGLQIIGRAFAEPTVLQVGAEVERLTPLAGNRPRISA